jgi:hypothetical protein
VEQILSSNVSELVVPVVVTIQLPVMERVVVEAVRVRRGPSLLLVGTITFQWDKAEQESPTEMAALAVIRGSDRMMPTARWPKADWVEAYQQEHTAPEVQEEMVPAVMAQRHTMVDTGNMVVVPQPDAVDGVDHPRLARR